jgi:hypothetical protein
MCQDSTSIMDIGTPATHRHTWLELLALGTELVAGERGMSMNKSIAVD